MLLFYALCAAEEETISELYTLIVAGRSRRESDRPRVWWRHRFIYTDE